jgi:hypothetical protein
MFSGSSSLQSDFCLMLKGLVGKIAELDGKPYELSSRVFRDRGTREYYPQPLGDDGKDIDENHVPFMISGTYDQNTNEVEIAGTVKERYKPVVREHIKIFAKSHPRYKFSMGF